MGEAKGWICLHRKIQECSIWDNDEKFDCRSAWIDLLLLANHEDKKTLFDGKPVVVKRGQRITSVRQLAERWHWGNDRTLRYLRLLESEKMIIKESDKRRTLITIVNYGVYNDMPNTDKNTDRTLTSTQSEHCPNTDKSQTTMNNNDNNDNNDNNETNNTPLNPPKGKKSEKKLRNDDLMRMVMAANPGTKLDDRIVSVLYEWCEYKEQKKQRYAEIGMRNLLNEVYRAEKEVGVESLVKSIRFCMANNYQGIYYKSDGQAKQDRKKETMEEWLERKEREKNEHK